MASYSFVNSQWWVFRSYVIQEYHVQMIAVLVQELPKVIGNCTSGLVSHQCSNDLCQYSLVFS
jgi:hypothetical protein